MVAAVTRDVQSALLVLIGGAVLRISLDDTYLRYVKEGLRPFLIVAGACLLLLGLVGAWADGVVRRSAPKSARQRAPSTGVAVADREAARSAATAPATLASADGHAADGHDSQSGGAADGHDHASGGPRIAWLLVLPVLAIFLVAPPALGSYAASRDAGTVGQPTDESYPPLAEGDPVPVSLGEYAIRAVWDEGRTLDGRTVRMAGFVTPTGDGNGWYLTRMMLSCCAADGRAIKVLVQDAAAPPPDTWVELTGEWVPGGGVRRDDAIPMVQAAEVKQIPAPKNPYESAF